MPAAIPEPDWKLFRKLSAEALQRYCQEILNEISAVSNDPEMSPHIRYLEVFKLIHERDETLAEAFNDLHRYLPAAASDQTGFADGRGIVRIQ